jgi:hypothetical protein
MDTIFSRSARILGSITSLLLNSMETILTISSRNALAVTSLSAPKRSRRAMKSAAATSFISASSSYWVLHLGENLSVINAIDVQFAPASDRLAVNLDVETQE